ncbi:MAG: type IV secretion protein Rhs, partial [Anaerolineae bacterium]|nr:type IV secretion protein Rhs [Anaerolineae bacterium]
MDIFDQGERAVERNRLYGVYPALVADINDPDGQGRVKVRLPWLPDDGGGFSVWARLATLMAGANRGTWFIPDVDDEVLVAFEGGDPRRPYVVGALWNGQDTPPETMDGAGNNFIKSITSRNGVKIT